MLISAISCAASGTSLQQRITCAKAASPLSRRVAVCIDVAVRGTGCISAFAGRRRSISRPRVLVTTAADGRTGGAAGNSSKVDRRRGRSSGKPSTSSGGHTRGRAADSSNNRPAAGAAQTHRQATGHHFQRPPKQSKPDRNAYVINDELKACTTVPQLQQLVQQDGPAMTYVNLATAIVTLQRILSKGTRQQQQVLQTADDLFSQLWRLQQSKLPQCGVRQLANMIYSACLLPTQLQKKFHWVVAEHLLPAFMRRLSSASPQAVSNVLYGMAASGQQLLQQSTELLIKRLVAVLHNGNPQDIANALWAVATMKQWVGELMLDQMCGALVTQLGDAAPQAVSNTLMACAELRYLPTQLLTAPALIDKLAAANPQNLANTAWACGQLGYRNEQLMSALLSHALELVENSSSNHITRGFIAQEVANLCWSLAVLDMREHAPAVLTLVQAAKPLWASMAPEDMSQLYQVHMWLTDHSLAGGRGLAGVLTAQQLQQCQSTRQQQHETTANVKVGATQRAVFKTCQDLPIKWLVPPAMEQVSLGSDGQPDGAALIDITARTADGVWLAIEADGPWHFRQPDGGLMGPTLYRNRALAVRGCVLISVPYYEWDDTRHVDRQQYMLDKVTAALEKAAAKGLHHQHLQPE